MDHTSSEVWQIHATGEFQVLASKYSQQAEQQQQQQQQQQQRTLLLLTVHMATKSFRARTSC
jgi:hypothetical protein